MKTLLLSILLFVGFTRDSSPAFPGRAGGEPEPSFVVSEIPDSIWQLMQGKTYTPNPHIGRTDLRYLRVLHVDEEGVTHVGELICNRRIADDLLDIFRQLYEARYPIQQMRLPEVYDADDERQMRANNTSCFCYRPIAGSRKLSKHALGLAVDINPLYNPYEKWLANGKRRVQPSNATPYCDRTRDFPYKITRDDLCYRLFTSYGFQWGGAWRSVKDWQHFER